MGYEEIRVFEEIRRGIQQPTLKSWVCAYESGVPKSLQISLPLLLLVLDLPKSNHGVGCELCTPCQQRLSPLKQLLPTR